METMEQKKTPVPPQGRQKMSYACEACRAAKTKCQPGPQMGICKRCSEFKRECIFRTGPRTRRPKGSIRADVEAAARAPSAPSKTFSIDFDMPVIEEPSDDFDLLREQHEHLLENLVLHDDEDEDEEQEQVNAAMGGAVAPPQHHFERTTVGKIHGQVSSPVTSNVINAQRTPFSFNDMSTSMSPPAASVSGTSMSWASPSAGPAAEGAQDHQQQPSSRKSRAVLDLSIKPQFNLENAARFLVSFRYMLPHMPLLILPEDATIRSLARESPFILLAILAVTSFTTNLQGYSLYDEEFRKVFGLKFVAGGERSLELLQGLLIYCTWYPFHLRPKNKQSYQYMKMAVDIIHDLELDRAPEINLNALSPEQKAPYLARLRAFLGCFYTMSTFTSTWGRVSTMRYSPQLARCVDVLEKSSDRDEDQHLIWLVRVQYVYEELAEVQRNFDRGFRDNQSLIHRDLIRVGLESQFRDFIQRMPDKYNAFTSIKLATLLTEIYILVPALVRVPKKPSIKDATDTSTPERLITCAEKVRIALDHIASLPEEAFAGFCSADSARFIVFVVIGYRLSFPLVAICREYDVKHGRKILDFGDLLRRLSQPNTETNDGTADTTAGSKSKKGRTPAEVSSPSTLASSVASGSKKKNDAHSAIRVVLRSVLAKYEEKSAALEAMSAAAAAAAGMGGEWVGRDLRSTCPMLNGSLEQYMPLWSTGPSQQTQQIPPSGHHHSSTGSAYSYAPSQVSGSSVVDYATNTNTSSGVWDGGMTGYGAGAQHMGGQMGMGANTFGVSIENKPLMHHDLWATMTQDWGGDLGEVNMEDFGNTGFGVTDHW
ncbi:hypothetical protein F5Y17DRAFT_217783 [Xylariaceae sp. FL0594]|nr:hypothetical protein F5Y17DRAFT_217783 [Xylariaceae sp. FL0594]